MKLWGREYEKGWELDPRSNGGNVRHSRSAFTAALVVTFLPRPCSAPGRSPTAPSRCAGAETAGRQAASPVRPGLASYTFRNFTRAQLIGL